MYMRITCGRVKAGRWDEFEAAFARTLDDTGLIEGLIARWLVRDDRDPDAGCVVGLWTDEQDMQRATGDPDWQRLHVEPLHEYFCDDYSKTIGPVRQARVFASLVD